MKSLLVDIYKTNNLHSGLGQFSLNFHNHLVKRAPENLDLHFLHPKNFKAFELDKSHYEPVSLQKRYFPTLNTKYDLWHSLQQFPSHMPGNREAHVLTIHDLNFLSEKEDGKAAKYLKKLQENVDRADHLTVISNYTKKVAQENLNLKGKSITTIHNGVELQEFENVEKPDFVHNDKFFFSLGILSAKKNFHVLIPMMEHFKDYSLIISGNKDSSYGMEISKSIEKYGLKDRVHLSGGISEKEKYWLYHNCQAFLFPSLAEGFGLPVIEAMSAGKAVFVSKYASLPEIGGEQAYYWDNFDPKIMSETIEAGLNEYYENELENSQASKKRAQQFNWLNCIDSYIELYNSIS